MNIGTLKSKCILNTTSVSNQKKCLFDINIKVSPVINGDGTHSRDFTYIDNVIQANLLALSTENKEALNQVYNVAYGERTTLNDLMTSLIKHLSKYDKKIGEMKVTHGPERFGDVPHSLASIDKAKKYLGYKPEYSLDKGLQEAITWYKNNLK